MKNEAVTRNLVKMNEYFNQMAEAAQKLDLEEIEKAINVLFGVWARGNQVFIIGNGGSASTATHFSCDLTKTTIVEGKRRFKVINLVDNIPLVSALTNDEGFDKIFTEQLKALIAPGDALIAVSVHGGSGKGNSSIWSQNLMRAIEFSRQSGAATIGMAGFDGGAMVENTDICMVVPCNSTPHVESMHLTLEHLICDRLRTMIEECDENRFS